MINNSYNCLKVFLECGINVFSCNLAHANNDAEFLLFDHQAAFMSLKNNLFNRNDVQEFFNKTPLISTARDGNGQKLSDLFNHRVAELSNLNSTQAQSFQAEETRISNSNKVAKFLDRELQNRVSDILNQVRKNLVICIKRFFED